MKAILILCIALLPLTASAQYGDWQYEEEGEMIEQMNAISNYLVQHIDERRVDYYMDALLWTMYKLECYRDTEVTNIDLIPQGRGQWEERKIVLHRQPTFEGFMEWKLNKTLTNIKYQ